MFSRAARGFIPALVALALLAGSTGAASAHMMHDRGGFGLATFPMLRSAQLTSAQWTQVRKIFSTGHTKMRALHDQYQTAAEDMATRYASTGKVSAADFKADLDTMARVHSQVEQQKLDDALKIRALLTPVQLQKLAQTHAKLVKIHAQMKQIHEEMRALFAQGEGPGMPAAAQAR